MLYPVSYAATSSPGQVHPQYSSDTPRKKGYRAVSAPLDVASAAVSSSFDYSPLSTPTKATPNHLHQQHISHDPHASNLPSYRPIVSQQHLSDASSPSRSSTFSPFSTALIASEEDGRSTPSPSKRTKFRKDEYNFPLKRPDDEILARSGPRSLVDSGVVSSPSGGTDSSGVWRGSRSTGRDRKEQEGIWSDALAAAFQDAKDDVQLESKGLTSIPAQISDLKHLVIFSNPQTSSSQVKTGLLSRRKRTFTSSISTASHVFAPPPSSSSSSGISGSLLTTSMDARDIKGKGRGWTRSVSLPTHFDGGKKEGSRKEEGPPSADRQTGSKHSQHSPPSTPKKTLLAPSSHSTPTRPAHPFTTTRSPAPILPPSSPPLHMAISHTTAPLKSATRLISSATLPTATANSSSSKATPSRTFGRSVTLAAPTSSSSVDVRQDAQRKTEGKTSLQLNLTGNLISKLPSELFELTNLVYLSLRKNHLTILPSAISHLTALKELDIGDNSITYLPSFILSMTWVQSAILRPNPFILLPSALSLQLHRARDQLKHRLLGPHLSNSTVVYNPPPIPSLSSSISPSASPSIPTDLLSNTTLPRLKELCLRVLLSSQILNLPVPSTSSLSSGPEHHTTSSTKSTEIVLPPPMLDSTLIESGMLTSPELLLESAPGLNDLDTAARVLACLRSSSTFLRNVPYPARGLVDPTIPIPKAASSSSSNGFRHSHQSPPQSLEQQQHVLATEEQTLDASLNPFFSPCPSPHHAKSETSPRRIVFFTPSVTRYEWAAMPWDPNAASRDVYPVKWAGCGRNCLDFLEDQLEEEKESLVDAEGGQMVEGTQVAEGRELAVREVKTVGEMKREVSFSPIVFESHRSEEGWNSDEGEMDAEDGQDGFDIDAFTQAHTTAGSDAWDGNGKGKEGKYEYSYEDVFGGGRMKR